jgi:hypothetical protein
MYFVADRKGDLPADLAARNVITDERPVQDVDRPRFLVPVW